MAPVAFLHLFLLLLSLSVKSTEELVFPLTARDRHIGFQHKVVQHDLANQPYPSTPVTNPVTTPVTNPVTTPATTTPENPAPTIVTIPATNPVPVAPNPILTPGTMPLLTPGTVPGANPVSPVVPVTNPVTTPANPGAQPVTNPVTTPTQGLPVTAPATNPTPTPIPTPGTTNAPAVPGQSWCVAKSGLAENLLQTALDYACGIGGADCSAIQQGGQCYNPNTMQNHASFAFNSYYQKNPVQTSCDFGGTATVTNQNPSVGSCVYPTSSSLGTPTTPTTASSSGAAVPAGSGTPPNVLNTSTNPAFGGTSPGIIGASPPADGSSISASNHFQASAGYITLLASIIVSAVLIPSGRNRFT